MSSLMDACAEMEKEAANRVMRTDEMTVEDGRQAIEWITQRIRKHTGNETLSFPAEWIPKTGMVVYNGRSRIFAIATLYLEKSSPVAVCGWCIANPENTPRQSQTAVKLLMSVMPTYAKRNGAKFLLTTFGNRGINRILDSLNFINGEVSENKFKVL